MNERREAYERGYEIGYPAGYWFRMNSGLVHDAGLDLLDATGPLDGSDFAAGHDDGWECRLPPRVRSLDFRRYRRSRSRLRVPQGRYGRRRKTEGRGRV